MTKLLEKAVDTVRKLSSENQDEIARVMLELATESEPEGIDPAHLSAVLESLAQVASGNKARAVCATRFWNRFSF